MLRGMTGTGEWRVRVGLDEVSIGAVWLPPAARTGEESELLTALAPLFRLGGGWYDFEPDDVDELGQPPADPARAVLFEGDSGFEAALTRGQPFRLIGLGRTGPREVTLCPARDAGASVSQLLTYAAAGGAGQLDTSWGVREGELPVLELRMVPGAVQSAAALFAEARRRGLEDRVSPEHLALMLGFVNDDLDEPFFDVGFLLAGSLGWTVPRYGYGGVRVVSPSLRARQIAQATFEALTRPPGVSDEQRHADQQLLLLSLTLLLVQENLGCLSLDQATTELIRPLLRWGEALDPADLELGFAAIVPGTPTVPECAKALGSLFRAVMQTLAEGANERIIPVPPLAEGAQALGDALRRAQGSEVQAWRQGDLALFAGLGQVMAVDLSV